MVDLQIRDDETGTEMTVVKRRACGPIVTEDALWEERPRAKVMSRGYPQGGAGGFFVLNKLTVLEWF